MKRSSPPWCRRSRLTSSLAAFALTCAVVSSAYAEDISALAARLASLRGEVEGLSTELSDKSQDLQNELRSLARQKAELTAELSRERTRLQKVRQSLSEKQKEIAAAQAADQELKPLFDKNLAEVRKYVQSTLPFRTDERLAELNKVDEQLKSGLLTPQRALMRLWTFVEDEFRMTRENGLYRQTIRIDGKEQLSDVIRVGTVALYFRTEDDRFGYVRRNGSEWAYQEVTDKEGRKQVQYLFDSFKKQIRVGFFELPNALPVGQ